MKPAIAIITPNTLAGVGLADIIQRMMPGADTCLFAHYTELANHPDADTFFHYFVSASEVLKGASYFLSRQHKTIVLLHGLVRSILSLAHRSHGAKGAEPEPVRLARETRHEEGKPTPPRLTPREREVLRGIVEGRINKEIAACMGVSTATVITHRKNLTEKLGTRSVSALTIFAVAHGIVRSEEI